jgi:REP element-mobilizing transposase RayT
MPGVPIHPFGGVACDAMCPNDKLTLVIHAFHVIFCFYGFWLPNDPRGSWSDFVWSWELLKFGKATKVTTSRSLAHDPHDRSRRLAAKQALKHPPVVLNWRQARAVARGFAQAMKESGYIVHACSIMPEHVHMVIGRTSRQITQVVGHLRARATQQLFKEALFPNDGRPVWAQGCWKVFLDSHEDVVRAIEYVERNPEKEGKRRQQWPFITPYAI